MRNEKSIFQPWQLFNAAVQTLGADNVAALLGVNKSTVYEYAKNPRTTGEQRCRDKAEQMHAMLSELYFWGRSDVCAGFIDYLRSAFEDAKPKAVVEPLPTIEAELLADYSAVATLQKAIESGLEVDVIANLTECATEEISRTFAKYLKDHK